MKPTAGSWNLTLAVPVQRLISRPHIDSIWLTISELIKDAVVGFPPHLEIFECASSDAKDIRLAQLSQSCPLSAGTTRADQTRLLCESENQCIIEA